MRRPQPPSLAQPPAGIDGGPWAGPRGTPHPHGPAGSLAKSEPATSGGAEAAVARELFKLLERLDRPGVELASIW